MRLQLWLGFLFLFGAVLGGCVQEQAGELYTTADVGHWVLDEVQLGSDARSYQLWVPRGYNPSSSFPVVMMLHGCTQDPDDFAAGTQMNALADQEGFLVVYPEQPSSANANKCWNWFEPAHQVRGQGEPAMLNAIIDEVKNEYNVHHRRVYVAGLSAGGAMAVIMGATYPDVFAGIGVAAGLEYEAATNLTDALVAMQVGGPDPRVQGHAAYRAMQGVARRMPVIVFHGLGDLTVNPVNAEQVVVQWAKTNDLVYDGVDNDAVDALPDDMRDGQVPDGYAYTRYVYHDAKGKVLMEQWLVEGMRHAWSGGSTAGSYADPKGPDASAAMWRFFKGH